jgi:hypothetical protein
MTTKNAAHREPMSETEALRIDLEVTRQHLAHTVQELSRQLNVPRRVKDSAGQAGRRIQGRMKEMPSVGRRHPKAAAAAGGAMALGVGAAAWMARRHK